MIQRFFGSAVFRVAGAAAQLGLSLVVARLAAPPEAGTFFFGYSLIFISASLCRLGTDFSSLRAVARAIHHRHFTDAKRTVDSSACVTLAAALAVTLIFSLASEWIVNRSIGNAGLTSFRLMLTAIPALALLGLFGQIFTAAERPITGIILQNLLYPSITVVAIYAASLTTDREVDATICAASLSIACWAACLTSLIIWYQRQQRHLGLAAFPLSIDRHSCMHHLRTAPNLLISSATSVVMAWLGGLILGFSAAPAVVAGYNVAMRVSIAVSVVSSAAASVLAPRMAVAHADGDLRKLQRAAQAISVLVSISTLPFLLTILADPGLFLGLFGSQYVAFETTLRLLVVGQLVAAVIGHSGMVLMMSGLYVDARNTAILPAIVLVAASSLLIPSGEADGAAAAMSIAVISGHVLAVLLVHRRLQFTSFLTLGELLRWKRGN